MSNTPDNAIEGYCLKCKEKRMMQKAQPEWASNGSPATRGICPVCSTNMYKRGHTPAHDTLPKPEITAVRRKKSKSKKGAKGASAKRRSGKLVVVESPSKARTIGRYLGREYTVKSSVGHVRDLLRSRLSVDVDNDFEPEYRVPNDKRETVKELKEAAARAKEIFLATDPDREGEAIAWHVLESAEMVPERTKRVVFHEITKPAILEAFESPREIDMDRVNAQQTRRVLDRLVGYKLSPLLWRKVRGRLSAGRVQSVAVRIVVDREAEIDDFESVEYWTLEMNLGRELDRATDPRPRFRARITAIDGVEPVLNSEAVVQPHVAALEKATFTVGKVKIGQRKRRPAAPFTTSTLQQEASRQISFRAAKTMRVAQQLYEGIDIGDEGTVGLITYMRTDSVNVAKSAQEEARQYITQRYGAEFIPGKPHAFKTRAKAAQEAHEAIRPTSVMRAPAQVKSRLTRDQFRLYDLVWKRFVASQMAAARYDTVGANIHAGPADVKRSKRPYLCRATGSTLHFAGFLKLYEESRPADRPGGSENAVPADLKEGESIDLLELLPEQHFTQPPPRYSEATLVKELEEFGIGRPSTYASILSTILNRGYVELEDRRLVPTPIGITVNSMLVEFFPEIVSVDFTAKMEADLDLIAEGQPWVPILREFYDDFAKELAKADANIEKVNIEKELEPVGRECPTCGHDLVYREGRYGRFIGCSDFPKCRFTEQILVKTGVTCPVGGGEIIERRTRRGRIFFGCSRYPDCEWTSWKPAVGVSGDQIVIQSTKDKQEPVACGLKQKEAAGDLVKA